MNHPAETAVQNFKDGYNCAQAVLCAFCEETGLSEETAFALSESFGGGVGGTHEGLCGALSGMLLAVSLARGADPCDPRCGRREAYAMAQSLLGKFQEKNGSTLCRELLGVSGVKLRSCIGCVEDAANIAAEYFAKAKEKINGD